MWRFAPIFAALAFGPTVLALEIEEDAVFVRIIDVGPGHAAVIRMPGDFYMVYDAGHWAGGGNPTFESIAEVIPEGEDIDLMVLSHSDADHLAAVDEILDAYNVRRVLRSGFERTTGTWQTANSAIEAADSSGDTLDINLALFEFPPGATYRFGDAFVTMVSGFHTPPAEWGSLSQSERRNAGSIVVRLHFAGRSILFTGDAVGRHIGDPDDALIATEKFMVDNSSVITIDSDVIIAPHHGADNGSSTAFIEAVSPTWVIFPAGGRFEHPRAVTAQRYLDAGVDLANIFRTDLGDNEGGGEWGHGQEAGGDSAGDDDVDILIRPDGDVAVAYRN